MSDDVLFILVKFITAMWAGKEDGPFSKCECDTPVSIHPDGLCGLGVVTSIGETDVEVTNHFARVIVSAEGIVTGIHLVKVDEASEQDIGPHVVWEYRAPWVVDDLLFAVMSEYTALLSQQLGVRGVLDSGFSSCTGPTYYCGSEYFYSQHPQVWNLIRTECSLDRHEHEIKNKAS